MTARAAAARRDLLSSVRALVDAPSSPPPSLPPPLVALAREHGVAGLFVSPTDTAARQLAKRGTAMEAAAVKVSSRLTHRGVRHAIIRGPVTAQSYHFREPRYYADVDILIDETAASDVRHVLSGLGFRQLSRRGGSYYTPTAAERALEPTEKRLHPFVLLAESSEARDELVIEVHHSLAPKYRVEWCPAGTLLDLGLQSIRLPEGEVPCLGPVATVIELAYHLVGKVSHLPCLRTRRDLHMGLFVDLWLAARAGDVTLSTKTAVDLTPPQLSVLTTAAALLDDFLNERGVTYLVWYFTSTGHVPVGRVSSTYSRRLLKQSSMPDLSWLIDPSELQEDRVLNSHAG